ncbi:unnamed protein product [Meganyctiphanes norvegica]|uniref:Uncharacterized protein n=1 Tax=Meganyctiphanes norvegica TaxID=48144 RepID=A0AAV2R039_MEGNR
MATPPLVLTGLLLKLLMLLIVTDYSQSNHLTPGEDCLRECTANDVRACHFKFNVHHYQTLSRACYNCPYNASDCARPHCVPGDGVIRQITVVNNRMPGPPIQV